MKRGVLASPQKRRQIISGKRASITRELAEREKKARAGETLRIAAKANLKKIIEEGIAKATSQIRNTILERCGEKLLEKMRKNPEFARRTIETLQRLDSARNSLKEFEGPQIDTLAGPDRARYDMAAEKLKKALGELDYIAHEINRQGF